MNCQEAQPHLSSYLEKSLDAIRMKSIETHLSGCPFCRAELHGLSECIRQVAELPVVDPPLGFAQRVVAHAREIPIEIELSAWQRILAALKTTMPIQAAATVLIAVLAVLLYQKDPATRNVAFVDSPRLDPSQAEERLNLRVEDSPANAPKAPARETRQQGIAAVQSTPSAVAESTSQPEAERSAVKDESKPQESSVLAKVEKPVEEKPLPGSVPARRRPTIKAQEVSTGSESRRFSGDALGIGASIGALSRSPFAGAPYSADRALSPLSEPNPDFEFVVRRRPRERRELKEEVRVDFPRSGAPAQTSSFEVSRSIAPATPVVEIRWFTVLPEHYEYFRKDLAAEANIESEKSNTARERDAAAKSSHEFLIKVTILQPE
ncbi:MAG TPA: zf-HC2 domain-containing protein [Candidatus Binatia bacterium]|nr:zf-HC2 domain-containing protein [Candidatus Binatia bacterium]